MAPAWLTESEISWRQRRNFSQTRALRAWLLTLFGPVNMFTRLVWLLAVPAERVLSVLLSSPAAHDAQIYCPIFMYGVTTALSSSWRSKCLCNPSSSSLSFLVHLWHAAVIKNKKFSQSLRAWPLPVRRGDHLQFTHHSRHHNFKQNDNI